MSSPTSPTTDTTTPDSGTTGCAFGACDPITPPPAEEPKHHRFGMSKLNYLDPEVGGCYGFESVDGSSEAAEKGTELHDKMEAIVKLWIAHRDSDAAGTSVEILNSLASGSWTLNDNEHEWLLFACRHLDKYLQHATEVFLEKKVELFDLSGAKLNHGTLDVLIRLPAKKAVLLDYKFGAIPVPHARTNRQGWGYAAAVMQAARDIEVLGVEFIQPKLNSITGHVFRGADLTQLVRKLERIIVGAKVNRGIPHPEALSVGDACTYCAHAPNCPALLKGLVHVSKQIAPIQFAKTFDVAKIQTPEQAAAARYAVSILEEALDGIKKRAAEVAEQNGGKISVTLGDGSLVEYEIRERGVDRVLGGTKEIFEVLKDLVSADELLAIADLSVGKLEALGGQAIYEATNSKLDAEIDTVRSNMAKLGGSVKATKEAVAPLKERKVTKEEAKKQLSALLESHDLLSRPDTKIKALYRVKN